MMIRRTVFIILLCCDRPVARSLFRMKFSALHSTTKDTLCEDGHHKARVKSLFDELLVASLSLVLIELLEKYLVETK